MKDKCHLNKILQNCKKASLMEILDAKENRANKQKQLLQNGESLISFTLNIPGSIKTSDLFKKGFDEGKEKILQQLTWNNCEIVFQEEISSVAGYELYILCSENPIKIKKLMLQIEESVLGRIFDIDVLGKNCMPISRSDLSMPPRKCYLCGETAKVCSRSQKHSYKELLLKFIEILDDYFTEKFLTKTVSNANRALLYEVSTSPKPGLVDCKNNGSHKDMNLFTFIDSTSVLNDYFKKFLQKGIELSQIPPKEVLKELRYLGKCAENEMHKITLGVNCHKGIIFSMGVICTAIGMRYAQGKEYNSEETLKLSGEICASLLDDFKNIDVKKEKLSYGERLYLEFGITGIRGEASAAYPTISKIALPALKKYLAQGLEVNEAGAWTLLEILAVTEDTNVLARSNMQTLKDVQQKVKDLLENDEKSLQDICELDKLFIEKNISPGGCADLLAITYFLYFMEN